MFTFDLGQALFGAFLCYGAVSLGRALVKASENVAEAIGTVGAEVGTAASDLSAEVRYRSRVLAGIVRARPPKPTEEDVKATPFDAWAGSQRGVDQKAMAHLRGSYLLLAGAKGPVSGDRREAAIELLTTYGAPLPPGVG